MEPQSIDNPISSSTGRLPPQPPATPKPLTFPPLGRGKLLFLFASVALLSTVAGLGAMYADKIRDSGSSSAPPAPLPSSSPSGSPPPQSTPLAVEQVLISATGLRGEMSISWATQGATETSEVVSYGTSTALGSNATGASSLLTHSMAVPLRIHVATLTGLQPNTVYYYAPGEWSGAPLSFTAQPSREGGKVYAVFGDLGLEDGYSIASLLSEAESGSFDACIWGGDFCYNFEDQEGALGNSFMNSLQPLLSRVPVFPVAGNHEAMSDNSFSQYRARLAVAAALGENSGNPGADANRWYSFDDGLVHWVCLDSELWSYGTQAQIDAQAAWLDADLARVDRSVTPWLLVSTHKSYFETGKTNWTALGFNAAFAKVVPDVVWTGHTHNYQRLRAFAGEAASDDGCLSPGPPAVYSNCRGTVGILAGSPGMNQGIGKRSVPDDVLVLRLGLWGYGHLTVVNSTALHWQWFEVAVQSAGGRRASIPWGESLASDEAWIMKAGG